MIPAQRQREHTDDCSLRVIGTCNCGLWPLSSRHARWVVRVEQNGKREYSTSPAIVLFQLTERSGDAHRFDRYEDASAHARHLSFVYRLEFAVVARVMV